MVTNVASEIYFGKSDCALFSKYPKSVNFNDVSVEDKEHYRSIRTRLKQLVTGLSERRSTRVPMQAHASIFNPNGRSATDLWCCLYPKSAPNKSYSLQVATILSQNGCELCFCLGAGTAQVKDPAEIQKNRAALELVRTKLNALPESIIASVENSLRGKWQYRRQWRQAPESNDFKSLEDWISYASSSSGDGASISRNLTPEELEELGTDFSKLFEDTVELFEPVFEAVYDGSNASEYEEKISMIPVKQLQTVPFDYESASKTLIDDIAKMGFNFEPWQIACYLSALRTKPFIILGGVSGTGKSQLPLLVSSQTGGTAELVPVRPDWTDSSDILGYVDLQGALRPGPLLRLADQATKNPDLHHVCVVDEMNLARVEHYFAEILSRIEETRAPGNRIGRLLTHSLMPKDQDWGSVVFASNLAVVGTVNMDESTHGFSKKVIDRAFTIEFSEVDLSNWEFKKAATHNGRRWPIKAWTPRAVSPGSLDDISDSEREDVQRVIDTLIKLNKILSQAQLQLGYRSRDEIAMFILHANDLSDLFVTHQGDTVDPLDLAIQMKVLPRIAGGTGAIRRVVLELLGWATSGAVLRNDDDAAGIVSQWQGSGRPSAIVGAHFPRTAARLCLMWERILNEGFTSFWL